MFQSVRQLAERISSIIAERPFAWGVLAGLAAALLLLLGFLLISLIFRSRKLRRIVIPSEGFFGIGINASGSCASDHQIDKILGDNQHDQHSDQQRDDSPRRAGDRQESRSRHNKCSPSDHYAEGHCPDIQRGQISVKCGQFISFIRIHDQFSAFVIFPDRPIFFIISLKSELYGPVIRESPYFDVFA